MVCRHKSKSSGTHGRSLSSAANGGAENAGPENTGPVLRFPVLRFPTTHVNDKNLALNSFKPNFDIYIFKLSVVVLVWCSLWRQYHQADQGRDVDIYCTSLQFYLLISLIISQHQKYVNVVDISYCYVCHIRPHSHSPFRHCHRVGDPPHSSLDCPSVHCLGVAAGWFAPVWGRWLWREVCAACLNRPIHFIHLLDASGVTSIDSSLKSGWRT